MVAFGGWEMPLEYSGIVNEHMAVRQRAGLAGVAESAFRLQGIRLDGMVRCRPGVLRHPAAGSLGVVGGLLGISVAASLMFPQAPDTIEKAAPPEVR